MYFFDQEKEGGYAEEAPDAASLPSVTRTRSFSRI